MASSGGFMDPAKRASVGARSETSRGVRDELRSDARLEEQVRDWLRYSEDLGLGPFYRDRPPLHAIAEAASPGPLDSRNVATSNVVSAAVPAAIAAATPGRAPASPIT